MMEKISNATFLLNYQPDLSRGYILAHEREMIDKEFADLAEQQEQIVRDKKEVAEQSGDSWHDGAFRATDVAANSLGNQAAALLISRSSIVVEHPFSDEKRVSIGSVVKIQQGRDEYWLAIVGIATLYPSNFETELCSVKAPLAQAIIGKTVGESASVMLNGEFQSLKILEINQENKSITNGRLD